MLAGILRCAWRDARRAEPFAPEHSVSLIRRGKRRVQLRVILPHGLDLRKIKGAEAWGQLSHPSRGVCSILSVTSGLCSSFNFSISQSGSPLPDCSSGQTFPYGSENTSICGDAVQ